jgi:uncharacterized protein YbdZ (MbtH family)
MSTIDLSTMPEWIRVYTETYFAGVQPASLGELWAAYVRNGLDIHMTTEEAVKAIVALDAIRAAAGEGSELLSLWPEGTALVRGSAEAHGPNVGRFAIQYVHGRWEWRDTPEEALRAALGEEAHDGE